MRQKQFANPQCVISDRTFWIGLIFYAVLSIGAVSVFGAIQSANYSGTLIFGGNARTDVDRSDWIQGRASDFGAVTLHSHLKQDFSPRTISSRNTGSLFNSLTSQIPEAPRIANTTVAYQGAISGTSESGLTPTNLALEATSSWIGEEVSPAPEPATWFAATLVLGAVVWSQRRRIAQIFAGTRKRRVIYLVGPVLVVVLSATVFASLS